MQNVLVIGGNGFLGAALLRALTQVGCETVRSFDLAPHPDPAIESLTGDVRDLQRMTEACAGMDTVFQTAALVDWGPRSRERLFAINVLGNRNVIAACREQGVSRLVYTSSIDVVFDGSPIRGGTEQLVIPARHLDDYGHTKAIAEADILQAHDPNGLQTCALRSAGIYGPGDRHRFPSILKAVRKGQLVYLGDGSARFDHVYITNLVEAHLGAARALRPGRAVGGQAYFITENCPGNFYEFFTPYLRALGWSVPSTRALFPVAYGLALVMEALGRIGVGPQPPLLTRYVVLSTCRDFYFSSEKAYRDFGYTPLVSRERAFAETLSWLVAEGYRCPESLA